MICPRCEEDKPKTEFPKIKGKIYRYRCLECQGWANLKSRVGVSKEEYYKILADQRGSCALCKISVTHIPQRVFDVDHCHETGKVRGLLCGKCNRGIGLLNDDVDRLSRAILYLRGSLFL